MVGTHEMGLFRLPLYGRNACYSYRAGIVGTHDNEL